MDGSEGATSRSHYGESGHGATGLKSRSGPELAGATKEFPGSVADRGTEAFAQTKETLSDAYNKTGEALNNTYEWMMTYGRQNPGRTILMAFGAGAGIGFLLASNNRTSHRSAAYFEPVVNAVSQFASEVFRRR